jgi:hypothetical protein
MVSREGIEGREVPNIILSSDPFHPSRDNAPNFLRTRHLSSPIRRIFRIRKLRKLVRISVPIHPILLTANLRWS